MLRRPWFVLLGLTMILAASVSGPARADDAQRVAAQPVPQASASPPAPPPSETQGLPNALPPPRAQLTTSRKQPFSYALIPIQQFQTGGDIGGKIPYGLDRLNFRIGYDLTGKLTLYWSRINIDPQIGAAYVRDKYTLQSSAFDFQDEIGIAYTFSPNVNVGVGAYRRWRECCPGAGDPTTKNPVQYHGQYIDFGDRFGPSSYIGKLFNAQILGVYVDHNYNKYAVLAKGATVRGDQFTIGSGLVELRIPVAHQTRFVPSIGWVYLQSYFDSNPSPGIGTAIQYGATITSSRNVTFTILNRTYTQHRQGTPYTFPQSQHYSYVLIAANIRGRF